MGGKENKRLAQVPFFAFESIQAKAERDQRRLLTVLVASMLVNITLAFKVARKGF